MSVLAVPSKTPTKLVTVRIAAPKLGCKIETHMTFAQWERLCSEVLHLETEARTTKPNWTAAK